MKTLRVQVIPSLIPLPTSTLKTISYAPNNCKISLSTGMYKKVFEVDDSDYDKVADVAMEAMTRATEEVVTIAKRSGHTILQKLLLNTFSLLLALLFGRMKKVKKMI